MPRIIVDPVPHAVHWQLVLVVPELTTEKIFHLNIVVNRVALSILG